MMLPFANSLAISATSPLSAAPPPSEIETLRQEVAQLRASLTTLTAQKELLENWLVMAQSPAEALEATLQNTLAVSIRLTQADTGSLFLVGEDQAIRNRILIRNGSSVIQQEQLIQGAMENGLAGWVARHREVGLIADTLTDERWLKLPDEPYQVRSALGVPLCRDQHLLGILTLIHAQPGHFTSEHVHFMQITTSQMTMVLDNVNLNTNLQNELTRRREAEAALQDINSDLEKRVQTRTLELASAHEELQAAYESTLEGWTQALDLRDKETVGHCRRVTEMTVRLAQAFGLDSSTIAHIRRGALLHDIGKMGVPDAILLKPSQLTEAEWVIMRQHPVYAHNMLMAINYLQPALAIPLFHHEKWDGTGYPRGLRGDAIPLAARLFAVVDVWDALSSDRPYRQGWPASQVIAHLRALAGSHFDPRVAEVFLNLLEAGKNFLPDLTSRRASLPTVGPFE